VESARKQELAREIREVGDLSSVGTPSWPPLPGDDHGAEEALREWVSLRDRNVVAPEVFPADGVVTVTWADLASFARCPLQFKLNRMAEHEVAEDVHTATGGDSRMPRGVDPAAFGVLVHEVLQRVAVGDKLDAAIESALQRQDFARKRNAVIAAARTLVENALAAGVGGPAPGARVEVPFMVRLDRVLVRGVIDRIDVSVDGATITDYKAGERSDEHSWQMRAYQWAASRLGVAPPLHGRVVYLRADGVETVDVSIDGGLDSVVVALDAAVNSSGFPATPGTACTACRHRPTCAFAIEEGSVV